MNPWASFEQNQCIPQCQCEGLRDALIRQPSSSWSSLAYVFAGFAIYRYVKDKTLDLKLWAFVCFLMGFSSFLGHSSFIRFTLAMDFASIILVMSFFSFWNFIKTRLHSLTSLLAVFGIYYCFLVAAMYSMDKFGKTGLVFGAFVFAIADVRKEKGSNFLKARTLQLSLAVFVISFGLYMMDELHIGCDPQSLLQLHSLWHAGTALSMFLYGKWRFDELSLLNSSNQLSST